MTRYGTYQYEGWFIAGIRSGHGQHVWPDKSKYTGLWKDDLPAENGVYISKKQEKYEGKKGAKKAKKMLLDLN